MFNKPQTITRISLLVAGLTALTACDFGKPMAVIPEPESQLTPKPGLLRTTMASGLSTASLDDEHHSPINEGPKPETLTR